MSDVTVLVLDTSAHPRVCVIIDSVTMICSPSFNLVSHIFVDMFTL